MATKTVLQSDPQPDEEGGGALLVDGLSPIPPPHALRTRKTLSAPRRDSALRKRDMVNMETPNRLRLEVLTPDDTSG
jgi:hypothetical protein